MEGPGTTAGTETGLTGTPSGVPPGYSFQPRIVSMVSTAIG